MAVGNADIGWQTAAEMPCDEMRRAICAATSAVCENSLGNRLRGLVLTGSLARDEATFVRNDAAITLVRDADFLIVLNSPAAEHPAKEDLQHLEHTVAGRLRQSRIHVHVGLGAVSPDYFNRLESSSFAYELKNCGRVVAGDPTLLDRIPAHDSAELSKEDAWRTLNHRMIEVLGSVDAGGLRESFSDYRFEYAITKLYLDMATSFLIFVGRYLPTYASRAEALCGLAGGSSHSAHFPFDLKTFAQRVAECTDRKLRGTRLDESRMFVFLEQAVSCALELWFWETARLSGLQCRTTIKATILAMGRRQNLEEKLRGWGSLVRRAGFRLTIENILQWTHQVRVATPRYLIYGAAAQLLGELPRLIDDRRHSWDPSLVRSFLPITADKSSSDEFHFLAREISWHYRTFLLHTVS